MDYEKKLEEAKRLYETANADQRYVLESLFLELKENEDEKIRRVIRGWIYTRPASFFDNGISKEEILAWLENQGGQKPSMEGTFVNVDEVREDFIQEVYRVLDADTTNDRANQIIDAFDNLPTIPIQKPADNVEPIFRVGDYIRNKKTGDKVLIVQVDVAEKAYCYVNYDGAAVNHSEFLFVKQDEWELLGYKVAEQKLAEDSVKISESSTEERDMTEYKKGFECGKQRVLKYPEDFGLCKKSDYKFDPKFKPGDWIITPDNKIKQIEYISFSNCRFTDGSLYNIIDVVNKAHLWTIQDAKDGDVLVDGKFIGVFKDNNYNPTDKSGCMCFYCSFDINKDKFYTESGGYNPTYFYPATKKQHDLLFQKMKEEGYEWNAEKKELKKIEPKFHEGEWITNGDYTWKIVMVKFFCYVLQSQGGNVVEDTIPHVDEQFHSFTIEDAKTGDVLVSELCYSIILFKGINDDNNIDFYCDYDFSEIDVPGDRFSVNNGQHYGNVEDSKDFHPATKEQRDILMKAMADAGYAFDFKKLELKKIVVPIFNIGDTIIEKDLDECGYGTIKDIKNGQYIFTDGSGINIDEQEEWQLKTSTNIERKPADWSEEDEKERKRIVGLLEGWLSTFKETCYAEDCKCGIEWLKSLKDRLRPKQEWSDKDEKMIHHIENAIKYDKSRTYLNSKGIEIIDVCNWLKSLRPQKQWKPTIKQLTALEYAVNDNTLSCDELYILNELYEQLKKL